LGIRSQDRKKLIPDLDPESGSKKALDPGSATLVIVFDLSFINILFSFSKDLELEVKIDKEEAIKKGALIFFIYDIRFFFITYHPLNILLLYIFLIVVVHIYFRLVNVGNLSM
jgi:hypothetical protein